MIDVLFNENIVGKILINTIFVSIPEELYLVMFTLIMVGEFEYWKESECKRLINRFDYVRVFLPTVTGALLSNILINTGLNSSFFHFSTPILMYLLIVFTNDIFGDASAIKWMVKAFIFYIIGFLSIGITEFIYLPFVLYGTGLTMDDIKNNLLIYFMTSLPSRLLQFSLITYLISRKRALLKGWLIKVILSSPLVAVIFSLLVLSNILFLQMMCKAIVFDKVLIPLSRISQMFIITGVALFPILNISGILWCFYLLKNIETKDKKLASEKLNKLLKDIAWYTDNSNFDNIRWKLNEIGVGIEDVAKNLYKEHGTE